jgi:hypothetical protein
MGTVKKTFSEIILLILTIQKIKTFLSKVNLQYQAFWWQTILETLCIGAVIVQQVVHLNPPQCHPAPPVQLLLHPIGIIPAIRFAVIPQTCIAYVKPPIISYEWCFRPVRLHSTTLCRPILGIPDACEDMHGFACGKC